MADGLRGECLEWHSRVEVRELPPSDLRLTAGAFLEVGASRVG